MGRNKDQDRERYHRRMNSAREQLGGKCSWCGSTSKLQFDHVDPKTKVFEMSHKPHCSEEMWQSELAKCQLLCKPCHDKKTAAEHGGESNQASKLTPLKVKYIRELHRLGHTQRSIAAEFGMNNSTINSIVRGLSWKEVK